MFRFLFAVVVLYHIRMDQIVACFVAVIVLYRIHMDQIFACFVICYRYLLFVVVVLYRIRMDQMRSRGTSRCRKILQLPLSVTVIFYHLCRLPWDVDVLDNLPRTHEERDVNETGFTG